MRPGIKTVIAIVGVVAVTAIPTAFAVGGDDLAIDAAIVEKDPDSVGGDLFPGGAGEIDFLNDLADELAAHLEANGIDHTVHTTEARWVEWDMEDDAAAELVEEFFDDKEFLEFDDLSDEEIAEIQDEMQALAEFLDEQGIAFTLDEDPIGITWVEWDWEDAAAERAVDEFYAERWMDEFSDEEKAEIGAEMAAEAAAIREALDEAGIAYTVETDPFGIEWPIFDEDDPAVWDVLDTVFEKLEKAWFEEVPEEEKAEIGAEMAAEAAAIREALDEAGIAYTVETDPFGIEWPIFDEDDPAVWDVLDTVFDKLDGFDKQSVDD